MHEPQSEPELVPYQAGPPPAAQRVLVLAPHPDDEVFGCGGCARLHRMVGAQVTVVVVTDGAGAGVADVRRGESEAACALLGLDPPSFWNYPDRSLAFVPGRVEELAQRIAQVLDTGGHDLVYAPSPWEVHPDHRAVAVATSLAVTRQRGRGQDTRWGAYEVGAPLWPTHLVDITAVLDDKQAAMAVFASQVAFQDYAGHIGALNRFRTYTLGPGCRAAEALWLAQDRQMARLIEDWQQGWRHPSRH